MTPDQLVGCLLVVGSLLTLALGQLNRPRCSRCRLKLPKADVMAERYSTLDVDGHKWAPLCSACFARTFV